ncbi:MAG: hypothetical protein ACYSTX_03250 [Planctomycetota bacterium]|jgi:hypothetical protein
MNKKTLIKVGIAVVVIGGILYYLKKQKDNKEAKAIPAKPPSSGAASAVKPASSGVEDTRSSAQKECEKQYANVRMTSESLKKAIADCVASKMK